MKYYKELAELGCFSQKELVQLLGSDSAAGSLASAYLKKGYVERIRRDLYATVSMETGQPIPTRYQIASKLADDAYISHMPSVRVVHGKGTGALRKAVHNYLRKQKHVESYRLGEFGEGDAGVTIVTFKK